MKSWRCGCRRDDLTPVWNRWKYSVTGAARWSKRSSAKSWRAEHELPNRDSRPRRIALTSDDAVWYTDFPRGFLGRFDPKTGEVEEWLSPSGTSSQPYGIATIDDVIWYVETFPRPNALVRFDPSTETFQSWPIPSGGGVVRNMMATVDGTLVLACSALNRVALVEIGS